MGFIGFAALLRTKRSLIGYSRVSLRDSCSVNHLFFCPSNIAKPRSCQFSFCLMKIPVLLFAGLDGAAVGGARSFQIAPLARTQTERAAMACVCAHPE